MHTRRYVQRGIERKRRSTRIESHVSRSRFSAYWDDIRCPRAGESRFSKPVSYLSPPPYAPNQLSRLAAAPPQRIPLDEHKQRGRTQPLTQVRHFSLGRETVVKKRKSRVARSGGPVLFSSRRHGVASLQPPFLCTMLSTNRERKYCRPPCNAGGCVCFALYGGSTVIRIIIFACKSADAILRGHHVRNYT